MKEALINIGSLLLNMFLIVLAGVLLLLLVVPAIMWKIVITIFKENRKIRNIMSGTGDFFRAIAICIDLLGNVMYNGLLNKYLLKNQIYRFGSPYETISEVLGWAQYYGDLTRTGKILVATLDFIDKNHCEKTRVHGLLLANKKVNYKK